MSEIRFSLFARRSPLRALPLALSVTVGFIGCSSSTPSGPAAAPVSADTWAVVDGHAIVQADVDKAFSRTQDPAQPLSGDEAMTAKLNLLNDLILQEVLLSKAGALKLEVPAAELDAAYNNAKNNMPEEAFQQELTKRNLTAAEMREGLRRELLTQKVIEQQVTTRVSVSDKEVSDFFTANRAQFNVAEEAYHLAQIVVTPVPEQQATNASGDDAKTPQEALTKAQMLMERLKGGASFRDLAIGYSEDPESGPRGGDLGLVPVSRLKQAPPHLRNAVMEKPVGAVNVASANGAHTLVLIVSHEMPGQRELTSPGVKEQITAALRARKEQLLRNAYLTSVRSDAQVNNYMARKLVEANTAPAPPATPLTAAPK